MSTAAPAFTDLDTRAVDTLRVLAMDAIERAGDGHPGAAIALAPAAYVLWSRYLRFDPQDPAWPDRDRFVLSAGHASVLQYAALHLAGYDLSIEDLRSQRQAGSRTPGHPERGHTAGIEVTTGPLGQGVANGVGLAIAERLLADQAGPELVDHRTWVFAGDGCLMEGVSAEASSLAGHLGLGKLIMLYDDNGITIDGGTDLAFTEDVSARYRAYGWQVLEVADVNDLGAVAAAYEEAIGDTTRPSLIRARSTIAWGAPTKQGTSAAHGAKLGTDEVAAAKRAYGWDPDLHFFVPEEVPGLWQARVPEHRAARHAWADRFAALDAADPDLAAALASDAGAALPSGWQDALAGFDVDVDEATRKSSQRVLAALAPRLPRLVGGSADLAGSNLTLLPEVPALTADRVGRNLHYGVREHAMGAIGNGIAAHGGLNPFVATFLVFSDYLRPTIRLAALMHLPVIYVLTHDSIGLGGDGPTHQPVEHLASLRAIPGLDVLRPADAAETAAAWQAALARTDGPTALVLTRQGVPALTRTGGGTAGDLLKGGYVLREAQGSTPHLLLIASGSEVHLAVAAADRLEEEGGVPTRVVSLPSWERFADQPAAYREAVLPATVRARLGIEAASPFGWERWIGADGDMLAVESYGASAPGGTLLAVRGFTVEQVVERARTLLTRLG